MEDERIDEWLYSLEPVTLKIVCALVDYVYKDIRRRILEDGSVKAEQLKIIESEIC